jgi:hypothetical protein
MASQAELIRKLEQAMPVANVNVQKQQKAARSMQLQQAVGGMTPQQATAPGLAQTIGGAQAQTAGQQAVQGAQTTQEQAGQLRGMAAAEQAGQQQKALGEQKLGLGETELKESEKLSAKARDMQDKLFKQQLQFKRDELGRTMYQETAKMDYALLSAKNDEDLKDKLADIEYASDQSLLAMEALNKKLAATLDNEAALRELDKRGVSRQKIAELKQQMEEAAAKKKAKAANRMAMYQAGGMIAGAVVGSLVAPGAGTAAGAAAGATIGGGVGTAVGGATA